MLPNESTTDELQSESPITERTQAVRDLESNMNSKFQNVSAEVQVIRELMQRQQELMERQQALMEQQQTETGKIKAAFKRAINQLISQI